MKHYTICVCSVQSPFVWGGAEILAESLIHELRSRRMTVEHVRIPLITYPKRNLLQGSLTWRLLNLESPIIPKVDLCIPLKFPSYAVRHSNKVPWLLHQFRDAYDIFNSSYYHFTQAREDLEIRESIVEIDNIALRESKYIYTISKNVSQRLLRYNGINSEPLYPPPKYPERYWCGKTGDYILSVGRLEAIKRVDLLIRAMALAPESLKCIIVGEGSQRDNLARLIEDLCLENRVRLAGKLPDKDLLELYANCGAVYYAPFDEDYGYVTIEAFLSCKPIITCTDSGGPLEFVRDRESGWIVPPTPEAIAICMEEVSLQQPKLLNMGQWGRELIKDISWDHVINNLIKFIN